MAAPVLVDLAAERLGGRAVYANDEFFAEAANLLLPADPIWREGEYTDRGKWMDGWETRRRREPGNDFCIIELGAPGRVSTVTVQTTHFSGNHPEACGIGGLWAPGAGGNDLRQRDDWMTIVERSALDGDSTHELDADDSLPITHVRLDIFPDGGVARLRLFGTVEIDWNAIGDEPLDLAALRFGGTITAASDRSFGDPSNMLLPGRSSHMGDGWETRRRRGPGHDWAVVRLGHRATLERVEVCTEHFKGNYPDEAWVDVCDAGDGEPTDDRWETLVPRSPLRPDSHHVFESLRRVGSGTHVRLSIHPDGGVSRFRAFGRPESGS
ncbi:MAG: allantoicase [Gemmatimonadota bacterium]|nr:allantoicase [Gemmatimonadota bacterium]